MDFFVPRVAEIVNGTPRNILDIGCCNGDLTLGLKKIFPSHQFMGIDLDPSFIAEARARAQKE